MNVCRLQKRDLSKGKRFLNLLILAFNVLVFKMRSLGIYRGVSSKWNMMEILP